MQTPRRCLLVIGLLLAPGWLAAGAQPMPAEPARDDPPPAPAKADPPPGPPAPGLAQPVPEVLGKRAAATTRRGANEQRGPIVAALRWLADHQADDGHWSPAAFADAGATHGRTAGAYGNADSSTDTGWPELTVGVTALAALAFLAGGYSPAEAPKDDTGDDAAFRTAVRRALIWLRARQADTGCIEITTDGNRKDPRAVYCHAVATLALIEAWAMTGNASLREAATRALAFLVAAQNVDEDLGRIGWRYGVQPGDSDTVVTTWAALPLALARRLGLTVDDEVLRGVLRTFDYMTGRFNSRLSTGYIRKPGAGRCFNNFGPHLPMPSAANVLVHRLIGGLALSNRRSVLRRESLTQKELAGQFGADVPLPDASKPEAIDYHYWQVASLAAFQIGGSTWATWQPAMARALISTQRMSGDASDRRHGSWDTTSAWGSAGGRVYTTAINCLTLQTAVRLRRLEQ